MTTCSICGQQVAVDELQEHMRIELLDPKWKEQRDNLEARKAQASELQGGANVVTSLQNLARKRVDIFGTETDEERRKREEALEREKRKEREKVVWDGHTSSKANTLDKFSTNVNTDEQIASIHRRKGLGPQEANAIGPGIGPAAVPPSLTSLPPAPSSLPAPPTNSGAYTAATVSSGPQPASMYNAQPPVMLPPLHYQGMDAVQPFGYQPAPGAAPGMHPTRMAALAAANSVIQSVQAGMVRSADEMEDGDEIPPAKRQKVAKLPGGALYPEEDWIAMHPVRRISSFSLLIIDSFLFIYMATAPNITDSPDAKRPIETGMETARSTCHDSRFAPQSSCVNTSRPHPTTHGEYGACLSNPIVISGENAHELHIYCLFKFGRRGNVALQRS